MAFSWSEMLGHMGAPALLVAVVLTLMGLASIIVLVERLLTLRRSRRVSRAFAAAVDADMKAGRFAAVLQAAQRDAARGYLPRVVEAALATYTHALKTVDVSGLSPVERTQRHMARYMEDVGADLRRGLNVLSSVGSVAPFVGLLGTVLGIISAFQGIAASGSGGLGAVSAGISEALLETALGLTVAIPSVLAFNLLIGLIVREEMALNNAGGELLDIIEDFDERRAQEARSLREQVAQGAVA